MDIRRIFLPASLALALLTAGCHSTPKSQNTSTPAQPAMPQASQPTQPPVAAPAAKPSAASRSSKSTIAPDATTAIATTAITLDQLDFTTEAATRGAGYALWVHVTRNNQPDHNAIVGVLNSYNHLVGKAYTDEHGDAKLIIEPGIYRLVAKHHTLVADKAIAFRRGNQINLALKPGKLAIE
jgi:hypothetical protein